MPLARRALTILIAAALAFVPVVAAAAGPHALTAKSVGASADHEHAMGHDHAAMQKMAAGDSHAAGHGKGKVADADCCDDMGTCAQTCLQKCFGQMAVMPPERTWRLALTFRIAPRPAERPPGWSSAPQLPPPRA